MSHNHATEVKPISSNDKAAAIETLRSILTTRSLEIKDHRTVVRSIFYKDFPTTNLETIKTKVDTAKTKVDTAKTKVDTAKTKVETLRVLPSAHQHNPVLAYKSKSKPIPHTSNFISNQSNIDQASMDSDDSLPLYSTSTAAVQILSDEEHLFGLKPSEISIAYQMKDHKENDQDKINSLNQDPLPLQQTLTHDQTLTLDSSDFLIHGLLGEGGMGQVFIGKQTCLKRDVAFKISKNESQDPRLLAQICHEAQITAQLDHPNIMPIYLLARADDGRPIQIMKRIEGISWHDLMYQPKHSLWQDLNQSESQHDFHLEILVKVSQAMSYAHERGIIHRDLKPENVMIGKFGEVYILDWGVALDLATVHGEVTDFWAQQQSGLEVALVGTPAYMPPEMALRDIAYQGAWSDVYLLGAILYQVLTGKRLHTAENIDLLLEQIVQGHMPVIPEEIIKEMRDLLQVSLAFSNESRLPNASAFHLLLTEAIRTSKSRKVEKKAWQAYHELFQELQKNTPQNYRLEILFDEAKHFFWTSLELWPMNLEARQGLDKCLTMWVRYLLKIQEVGSAERVIGEIKTPNEDLLAEIAFMKSEREDEEIERRALKSWKADENLGSSKKIRVLWAYLGFTLFGLGSLFFDFLARLDLMYIDAKRSLLSAIVLSALAIIGFLILSPKDQVLKANSSFIRLSKLLLVIMLSVVLQRFFVWKTMPEFKMSLIYEMILLVVGCSAMNSVSGQKDFTWGTTAFVVSIILSLLWPYLLTTLYALSMCILWGGVLWNWKKEST
jgi:eukaryotic-like serine/threonine-protein kinase